LGAFTRANSDTYVIPTQLPWTAFAQQAPPDPDIEGWQLAPLTEAEIAGIIVGRRAEGPNGSRSPLAGAAFIRSPNGTTINGGLCGSGASSTLMVQNGSVRAGGSGVSVSGQVGPSGSVSLALQKSGVQGSASGKLSGSSGSGSWSVSSLGCSGHWTARRA
jgi:hypothetical protein